MDELRELYQELILDHGRKPRNRGPLPEASHSARGFNPLCGDQVTMRLILDGDRVSRVMFEGQGCAISTASASTLTQMVKGLTVDGVEDLFGRFHDLVTGKPSDLDELGKLAAFGGVSEFPMRVKCATLAWHTLRAALKGTDVPVTTE